MTQDHSSVSSHLKIPLSEYDGRIRTFVPFYEEMLDVVADYAGMLGNRDPVLLDLGIGTGALTERCRRRLPAASFIGIDMDPGVLAMAAARLGTAGVDLRCASYMDSILPRTDLIVASLSLHHIHEIPAKRALYRRCREALKSGGVMIIADCFLPRAPAAVAGGLDSWRSFLDRFYTAEQAQAYLEAWALEDSYFALSDELAWLADAGFQPDVVWRRDLFAVVAAS